MKFQGAGKVYLADRDGNGAPGAFDFRGCSDALNCALSVDTFEHIERCTGNNGVDYRGIKKKSMSVTLELTEFTGKNMALAANGLIVPAGTLTTVTDEELPTVIVGQTVMLGGAAPKDGIADLVITDSGSPSPATLTEGTDYVFDADFGTVQFLTATGTQPYVANYSHTNKPYVSIFTAPISNKWLRFNYLNVANDNAKGVVDLYNTRFDPAANIEFINDEIQKLSLVGSVLIDPDKLDSGPLGQFGRVSVPA